MTTFLRKAACCAAIFFVASAPAQSEPDWIAELFTRSSFGGVIETAIGITRLETPMPARITADDLDFHTPKTRILLIGGLDGSEASARAAVDAFRWFHNSGKASEFRERFAVSLIPLANPDGWTSESNGANASGGNPLRGYPPPGDAYQSVTDPEAVYLWRWIGMHASDWVVDVRAAQRIRWLLPEGDGATPAELSESFGELKASLRNTSTLKPSDELVPQLVRHAPSGTGPLPAIRAEAPGSNGGTFLRELLTAIEKEKLDGPSPARRELQRRLDRTPIEIAEQLAVHYGHKLDQVAYIPAVALIGRIRLGKLTNNPSHLADVERIVAPYVDGTRPTLPERTSGSTLSGHLIFSELARVTGNPKYTALARAAAELGFDDQGQPKVSMPFHNEMSDAVFMGGPILAETGRLTGEAKYFDMLIRHFRFMKALDLRSDGLYRHSPLAEAAWGRGNGFPALGLALSLTALPDAHPARAELSRELRAQLEALVRHQDPTGTWHQVIDRPGSYRELTSTSMIVFAMVRGVRLGLLEPSDYDKAIERAWYGIRTRIASNGELVDVCTSTGKQPSLRHYLDRKAILGRDDRGGGMALLAATEMAVWLQEH